MNIEQRAIAIRSMTASDVRKVVDIHSASFPNSRSSKLGEPFLKRMYQWYLIYQPQLSFVAVRNKEVIGFVTGTLGWGGGRRRFKFAFWHIVWGFLRHPRLFLAANMFEAWLSFVKGLLPTKKNIFPNGHLDGIRATLDSIAVGPDARGLKIGRALMRIFETAARAQGATYVSLGVEADNHAARRLYESCGWKLMQVNAEQNSVNYVREIKVV
jgi:ribosomal protein S18 acetylase RimI-like enzyme